MVVEVTLQNSNNYGNSYNNNNNNNNNGYDDSNDMIQYGTYSHNYSSSSNGNGNKVCWYPGRDRQRREKKKVVSNRNRNRTNSTTTNNNKNKQNFYQTKTVSTAPGRPSSNSNSNRGRGDRNGNGSDSDRNGNGNGNGRRNNNSNSSNSNSNSRSPFVATNESIISSSNAVVAGRRGGDHRGGYRGSDDGGKSNAKPNARGGVVVGGSSSSSVAAMSSSVNSITDLSSSTTSKYNNNYNNYNDNESTAYYSETTTSGGGGRSFRLRRRQRSPNSIIPEEDEDKDNEEENESSESVGDNGSGSSGSSNDNNKTTELATTHNHHHHHLRETTSIAAVETNCTSKQFWTDEIVEGGAFACFESIARRTRCLPGQGPSPTPSKSRGRGDDITTSAANTNEGAAPVSATLIPEEFDETTNTNPDNHDHDDDALTLNSIANDDDDDDDDNLTTIEDRVVPTAAATAAGGGGGLACTDEQRQWQAAMLQHAMCSDTPATLALASPDFVRPGPHQLMSNGKEEEEGDFLDDESLTQLEIIPKNDPLLKKQQPNNGYSQVQYISEEPLEVYQDKNAFRRAMCTNIKLRKEKQKQEQKNKENQKQNKKQKQKQKQMQKPKQSLANTEKIKQSPEETQVRLDNSIHDYGQMSNECSVTDMSSVNYPPSLSAERRQQNGGMLPASLIAPWKDCPAPTEVDTNEWIHGGLMASGLLKSQQRRNLKLPEPPTLSEDEDAANFYVEVEAMKEQLNGIKDLEDLERTDGNQGDEEVKGPRIASLVDNDSTFMESVNAKPANHKMLKNQKNEKKVKGQNGKKKGLRLPTCGRGSADDRTYSVSYTPGAPGQTSTRTGQPPTSTKRGDELEGGDENVSAPVPLTRSVSQQIAMRALELSGLKQGRSGPSTPSRNSRTSQSSESDTRDATVPLPANGDVSSMSINRSGMDISTSKDTMNRSAEMSIESRSSRRHLNKSSGTESPSRDSYERSNMSLNASRDVEITNDETGEWRESEIGYYRTHVQSQGHGPEQRHDHQMIGQSWSADSRPMGDLDVPQSPILSQSFESGGENDNVNQAVVNFPDILSSLSAPKFDDNFWQEDDASGLDTNAFEEFDTEQDSIFDDLRSTSNISTPDISSKGSVESGGSAGDFDDYLEPPTFDLLGQNMSPEQKLPKFQENMTGYSTNRSFTGRSGNHDNSMRYSTTERTERSTASKTSVASPFAFREEEFVDFDAQMI